MLLKINGEANFSRAKPLRGMIMCSFVFPLFFYRIIKVALNIKFVILTKNCWEQTLAMNAKCRILEIQ